MKTNLKRRKFIETSAKGLAGAGLIAASSCTTSSGAADLGDHFIHHVFFWLKDPQNPGARKRFEAGLTALVRVETIASYHLGIPAGTSREVIDGTYSYSLLTIFRDRAGQDTYQTHPIHLKFIEDCQDLWEKVVVYDSVKI